MRTRGWTKEQDEILRGLCKSKEFISMNEMSKIIGKSPRNIYSRIQILGLKRKGYRWSKEEDELVSKLYAIKDFPVSLIAKKVNRTERAVLDRVVFLKVKRSEPNNDIHEYILKNYGKDGITAKDISDRFNRPIKTVYRMARELGVASRQEFEQITTMQIDYIIKNYATENTVMMSIKLGIPDYTIRKIANKYNVKKDKTKITRKYSPIKRALWTKEKENFIILNHKKMTMKQMARELYMPYGTVKSKITSLGLNKQNLKIYNVGNVKFKYCTEEEKQSKLEYINMFRQLISISKIGDIYK